ncbi:nuclease-related domain-containing protein [Cytobacillus sp. IB215316]|uniref:nuclease-related domain-containing protein n=1 Tax=Cytobacillus sp. IB215316 TaxID=3097354 RepID=UPI002A0D032D|nr:nuclease-related domain-containing protein [Cytobacillus sp. IB215316]MDX8363384.1 nuclease-related domain-containing protein [Cytobacillus sp. IB215316]
MILFLSFFKKNSDKSTKSANSSDTTKQKGLKAIRKGELGEYKIEIQLEQLPKEYKHLNDLLVENSKAKSGFSQVDHIVITPYGIFVIETKNYQGTIYGGKDRKTWSVNGKFNMMNPFIQNYGHIQALKSIIDKKYHHLFISMVSFTKRCTFKLDELDLRKISSDNLIVYDIELSEFINRKISVLQIEHEEPLLSEADITNIFNSFYKENITDSMIREKHIYALKYNDKTEKGVQNDLGQEKCSMCNKPVSDKVKSYCLSNKKFKGKIYCFEHQKEVRIR